MILLRFAVIALDLIRIKYQNQLALPIAAVVAQHVHQLSSGTVQIVLGNRFQLVPRKNDVVAVYQQVLLPVIRRIRLAVICCRGVLLFGGAECLSGIAVDFSISPFKNRHEFLVLCQTAPIGCP